MDRFIADDRELVGARRHPDQNVVVVRVLVQSEPMKSFFRGEEWIVLHRAALNEDTDLAGGFRFSITNRLDDRVMLELAEKFFCPHYYQLEPPPPPPKLPPPPLNPLNPPPLQPEAQPPPPPPPNPIGMKIGPRRPEE